MTRYRGLLVMAIVLAALFVEKDAWAGPPTEQLRVEIDRVVKTLEDPALKGEGKTAERRQRVQTIANGTFDWAETAKRSLARHWQRLTDEQREEFVKLFGDMLERSYISKIDLYSGERVAWVSESVAGDQATVRTKVITKQGTDVPIDYHMFRRGDRWLVYDVVIENVSLVNNYRTQFNRIIQTSSYQDLITKMRTKLEESRHAESSAATR